MASGNMKDIKTPHEQIGQCTMQITKADGAGRHVQAAPREGACARAVQRRTSTSPVPDDYASGGCNAQAANRSIPDPRREVKNSLYIVIAGDRGLAGGYNANLFKLAAARDAGQAGDRCITIGKKAQEHYQQSVR